MGPRIAESSHQSNLNRQQNIHPTDDNEVLRAAYAQLLNEFDQVFYREIISEFDESKIEILPDFPTGDPLDKHLRPADLVRNIKFVARSSYDYVTRQADGASVRDYATCYSHVALRAVLPRLVRCVNKQCRIVLKFDGVLLKHEPPCKLQLVHDVTRLVPLF